MGIRNMKTKEKVLRESLIDRYCDWVSENKVKGFFVNFFIVYVFMLLNFSWIVYWTWRVFG